jgi:hypothetical protein
MAGSKLDLLQGTLDLMVLQTLASMGALNGYRLARRIEQVSGNEVLLHLRLAGAPPAAFLDRRRVGHLRHQPASQVLLHYASRPETTD